MKNEQPPPIFRSWQQFYAFVLIMHVLVITLFYLFTKLYE